MSKSRDVCPNIINLDSESDDELNSFSQTRPFSYHVPSKSQPAHAPLNPKQPNLGIPKSPAPPRPSTEPTNIGARKRPRNSKAQREAELKAKRDVRIKNAFKTYDRDGAGYQKEIEILVSPALLADTSRKDVLQQVRVVFPGQIFKQDRGIKNLISWRRKSCNLPDAENENLNASLVVFCGDAFLQHISAETLDGYAQCIISVCGNNHLIFLIIAAEKECKKRAQDAFRSASKDSIISRRGVQDSYTHLYMEYGIRTKDCANVEEASHYIRDMTDAVAGAPYYHEKQFLQATLDFKNENRMRKNCTAVLAMPSEGADAESTDSDNDDGMNDQAFDANSSVVGPIVRAEGKRDLGFAYLSMLCLIPGVSIHKARAIRFHYPTLYTLLKAYGSCADNARRAVLLQNITFGPNNRRIGRHLSQSVATVLTSLDGSIELQP